MYIWCLFLGPSVLLSHKDQSLPSLFKNYFWLFFKSLLVLPCSQHDNLLLTRLAKLPLHLFPLPFIFLAPFIFFPMHADSLVPLLLNYALLFPQPEELTAEALFLTLFCIPSMSHNLFWVLFAAKMLMQHQFCFHGLTGYKHALTRSTRIKTVSYRNTNTNTSTHSDQPPLFFSGCVLLFLSGNCKASVFLKRNGKKKIKWDGIYFAYSLSYFLYFKLPVLSQITNVHTQPTSKPSVRQQLSWHVKKGAFLFPKITNTKGTHLYYTPCCASSKTSGIHILLSSHKEHIFSHKTMLWVHWN